MYICRCIYVDVYIYIYICICIYIYICRYTYTVEFVTRGRFVEVVMGWIANGAKNRQRSPWSMDSPRRPLVDLLGQTQKRPNTEPQGVPEFLD